MDILREGLSQFQLNSEENLCQSLRCFASLIDKANETYGLVKAELPRLITHHILDSLSSVQVLRKTNPRSSLIDIGSGAGLPGIPLALVMPEIKVTLLDRSKRRILFLRRACQVLGLDNVEVIEAVFSEVQVATFDVVTCRAMAPLSKLLPDFIQLRRSGRVVHANTTFLMYQGMKATVEREIYSIKSFDNQLKYRVVPVRVPYVDAERHLILIKGFSG